MPRRSDYRRQKPKFAWGKCPNCGEVRCRVERELDALGAHVKRLYCTHCDEEAK